MTLDRIRSATVWADAIDSGKSQFQDCIMISGNQYVYPSLGTAAASTTATCSTCGVVISAAPGFQLRHYDLGN